MILTIMLSTTIVLGRIMVVPLLFGTAEGFVPFSTTIAGRHPPQLVALRAADGADLRWSSATADVSAFPTVVAGMEPSPSAWSLLQDASTDAVRVAGALAGEQLDVWTRAAPGKMCETTACCLDDVAAALLERGMLQDADDARIGAASMLKLAGQFRAALGGTTGALRLRATCGTNGCMFWHTDAVALRGVCATVGPGSRVLRSEDVNRDGLRPRSRGGFAWPPWKTQERVLLDPVDFNAGVERGAPLRAARGELLLLKGELWDGHGRSGVVHRSPLSAGDGRVLLSVDVLADVT